MKLAASATPGEARLPSRHRAGWKEWGRLGAFLGVFIGAWFLPYGDLRVQGAIVEALAMTREYARQHVLLCLVPALFIAGAIGVFVSQAAVMKYLGPAARRVVAYPVAAVSGTILAVCSCTVLPLFSGIHRRGAGLGPAVAFLYSGPAINVLAIILTARVLGLELGAARAVFAVLFSILIGLAMQWLFRAEESKRSTIALAAAPGTVPRRTLPQTATHLALLVAILVFANWSAPSRDAPGVWNAVGAVKWPLTLALLAGLGLVLWRWFEPSELSEWVAATWDFAKQILPLLFVGVLVAGLLLGRPGHEGLIPSDWVAGAVGGNSLRANLFASVAGAFMYFATLTEVPIVQGLVGAGMGQGPALALLLAGPALSLPSMLVIRSVLGTQKTLAYVGLVVLFAAIAGLLFGAAAGTR